MSSEKTYCPLLWKHLCVGEGNLTRPCCRFIGSGREMASISEGLEQAITHPQLLKFQEMAKNGQPIEGCKSCYANEAAGIKSLRQKSIDQLGTEDQLEPLTTLENIESLEIFLDDLCNLKCLMCSPELSTSWRPDYEKLKWKMPPPAKMDFSKVLNDLPRLTNLKLVKFVGGEPLLSKNHLPFLQAIGERASEVTLHYNTNSTISPSHKAKELWKNFKKINIYLSVDGFGVVNDYIRYPSKWNEVDSVVDEFIELSKSLENMNIVVLNTVSILNVFKLDDFILWFNKKKERHSQSGLSHFLLNPLVNPDFLSFRDQPEKIKVSIENSLPEHESVSSGILPWLKAKPESINHAELLQFVQKIDGVRGNSIKDVLPELCELMDFNQPLS